MLWQRLQRCGGLAWQLWPPVPTKNNFVVELGGHPAWLTWEIGEKIILFAPLHIYSLCSHGRQGSLKRASA